MNEKRFIPRVGLIFAFGSSFCFALTIVCSAYIIPKIGESTPMLFRFMVQMVISVPAFFINPEVLQLPKKSWLLVFLSGIFVTTFTTLAYFSYSYIPPLEVSTLLSIQPVFLILIAFFILKEKVLIYDVIGVIVILGAIPLVTQPPFLFDEAEDGVPASQRLIGCLLSVGGALAVAINGATIRYISSVNSFVILFFQSLVSSTFAIVSGYDKLILPVATFDVLMLTVICVSGSLARLFSNAAYQKEDCTIVGAIECIMLFFVALLQYFIMKISPNWLTIVGGIMIISSVVMIMFKLRIADFVGRMKKRTPDKIPFSTQGPESVCYQAV